MALIGILPFAAMLLFATHTGREILDRTRSSAEPVSLFSGVTVEDTVPPAHGVIVTSLRSDSPAASAGVAVGDDLEAFDGQKITSVEQARNYLLHDSNRSVAVLLYHNHHTRRISLPRGGEEANGA